MCGIAGYKTFGKEVPTQDEITGMLLGIESRGGDATGLAKFDSNNKIVVIKDAVKSDDFVKTQEYDDFFNTIPKTLIMHTRKKTKGEVTNNLNNHPIWHNGSMIAMVHNGMIGNDDLLFEGLNLNRVAEVDSEIIYQIIKSQNSVTEGLIKAKKHLVGSAALAIISEEEPDKLFLARYTNPIELFFDKERDILFFASLKEATKKGVDSLRERMSWRGFAPDLSKFQLTVSDNLGLVIGENGLTESFDWRFNFEETFRETQINKNHYGNWQKKKEKERDNLYSLGYARIKNEKKSSYGSDLTKLNTSELWDKWIGLNNGDSSVCSFCDTRVHAKKVHKSGKSVCVSCFIQYPDLVMDETRKSEKKQTETLLQEDTPLFKCSRCNTYTEEKELADWAVLEPKNLNLIKRNDVLCPTCYATMDNSSCDICGEFGISLIASEGTIKCFSCDKL